MKKAITMAGCLFCLWACVCARPAAAAYMMTEDLERSCLSSKKEQISACMHYIGGVIDYHILMQSLGIAPAFDFCLPPNLPLDDAAVAVMAYLRSNPQHDAFIAAESVPLALHDRYPCHPKPPKAVKAAAKKKRKR